MLTVYAASVNRCVTIVQRNKAAMCGAIIGQADDSAGKSADPRQGDQIYARRIEGRSGEGADPIGRLLVAALVRASEGSVEQIGSEHLARGRQQLP